MSAGHRLLKFVRQLHLYLGAFSAPALLFFAVTGGLQVFGLHEAHRGSDYHPPAWLAVAAQLHKKQTMAVPARRAPPAAIGAAARPAAEPIRTAVRKPSALPLKLFSALVALGLLLSTLSGVYMAYRYTRNKRLVSLALAGGVLVPVMLALL
ncbi:PepSY domain-containing protein [Fulvimonas sp. R45]|uniref:PepSY domain-containing protein n=1 Tax=Fulvimonas sp. R45 TaxID=3045937 RepID=UPI00265F6D6A|nr:PepSY domain-containing protein [Fulvimonas sp. R45]MDO1527834.1 PepSY domain-containing protein [Fulvimonas sp. R45]